MRAAGRRAHGAGGEGAFRLFPAREGRRAVPELKKRQRSGRLLRGARCVVKPVGQILQLLFCLLT